MKKPKYLYHGSSRKLKGKKLIPKKPSDIGKTKENKFKGVFATDIKQAAIVMALLSCKGVGNSSLSVINKKRARGIVYSGWPKQEYIYLYILPSKGFDNMPKGSWQWISFEPVKPLKTVKFKVSGYLDLIDKATKKEKEKFKELKKRG